MGDLKKLLQEEEQRLINVIIKAESIVKKSPSGYIRAYRKGKRIYYYYKEYRDESKNGNYVKVKDKDKVIPVLTRNYCEKIISVSKVRLNKIQTLLTNYEKQDPRNIYMNLSECQRVGITPLILTDSMYKDAWQAVSYTPKPFADGMIEIYSERGERVRSKSEKIIADKLYREGIPYRYEYPMQVAGYGVVYPDFTILDVENRREIILEHLGMIDNEDYQQKFLQKLQSYEKSGLMIGSNLILTYETARKPFDSRQLHEILKAQKLI